MGDARYHYHHQPSFIELAHRNPTSSGVDARQFSIEHMSKPNEAALHHGRDVWFDPGFSVDFAALAA